ncbi:MAG: PBP1A family penicillin-binding protein [Spirochaetia bacterium]|nr:PBP1A family penicillin-binding protein [Spirochaetia bacterium]
MFQTGKRKLLSGIFISLTILTSIVFGLGLGFFLSASHNIDVRGDLSSYTPALPTQILDRHGELITEIFSEEKRDIVPIDEFPKKLLYALISREDSTFYTHKGVDLVRVAGAAFNILTGRYFSGASTLTMQVAGWHYADRKDITVKRKLKELWYAFQFERDLSKNEILEIYLNQMYFGHNAYGVESASQFYFGRSSRDISIAESAILVVQLASPALYSPINHPERARDRQIDVLKQMVNLGYATQNEVDLSFQQYWDSYNYTRSNISSAYFDNDSKAPYFSEYVRIQLNDMLYGAVDINKDGYIVNTTLDLGYQTVADEIMEKAYHSINERYKSKSDSRLGIVDKTYVPVIDMLSLMFDLEDIQVAGAKQKKAARNEFYKNLSPTLELMSLMFGLNEVKELTQYAAIKDQLSAKKTTVEGALITIDDHSGHILSMIGGSDFETKKYNRAIDAQVQPGSSFKPLYYSAAIGSKNLTTSTRLYDGPIVFFDDMGNKYTPTNYLGEWEGSVLLRHALATSMNVPSLQVLDSLGFEPAIERASRLLGMEEKSDDRTLFPRSFPLGLGITSVAPINMVRAFATFPNQGKAVIPISIISVLDRNGNVVLEPEKDRLREQLNNRGKENDIMTPQNAYIMVSMLQSTVEYGTLKWRRINIGGFDGMPMAGKTGTTQNWGDAWTVGFSPYYTTAIWFGFDTPGNSLGRELTGATAAGPVWAEYMKAIHTGLKRIDFQKPETGLVEMKVCAISGKIPTSECVDGLLDEIFIAGTEPKTFCDIHTFNNQRDNELIDGLRDILLIEDFGVDTFDLKDLSDDLFNFDDNNINFLLDDIDTESTTNSLLD